MEAAELVQRCRAELDAVEQRMLDAPNLIPLLRQPRAEAQAALLAAEWRAAVEAQAAEPRPTREELWAYWCDCRPGAAPDVGEDEIEGDPMVRAAVQVTTLVRL